MKKIEIIGTGCPSCKKLYEQSEESAKSLGIEYTIEKVDDITKIMEYGILSTPGLVVDGEVKLAGRVPGIEEIKKHLR